MLRYLMVAAAFALAGCVTPMSAADQTPAVQYSPPDRTLIAVIDERVRTEQGQAENFAGFARSYGIPISWTVQTLMLGAKEDKDLTMSQLLSARIASGLSAHGGDVRSVVLPAPLDDAGASALLDREDAGRLMTVQLKDWHFDLNVNWVGRFQFNSDAMITVQNGSGTLFSQRFAEQQAIQARAEESWPNMILQAYRAKMEQILHDEGLRAALTASAPPAVEAEPAAEGVAAPML